MGSFEIVELEELSGKYTKIYSIVEDGCDLTLYEKFVEENQINFQSELNFITKRIFAIGNKTGAIESFFKPEGSSTETIHALFDEPGKMVRLYCIKLGQIAIILGGGGPKAKDIRRWQDDAKLTSEMAKMKHFMNKIDERFRDRDLWWNDENELDGDFIFL